MRPTAGHGTPFAGTHGRGLVPVHVEKHDAIVDIVYVQSGEGTLVMGGTMAGRKGTSPGEWEGTRLDGGDRHPLGAGDIVHIPAGIPHSFLVPGGKHLTYVLLKIPAK